MPIRGTGRQSMNMRYGPGPAAREGPAGRRAVRKRPLAAPDRILRRGARPGPPEPIGYRHRAMPGSSSPLRRWCAAPALVAAALVFAPTADARPPVRAFTLADGLAGNHVHDIFSDSRGLLWLATSDGLSRFDGERFRTWLREDGLPSSEVGSVVEGADGSLWIATTGGVARLDPNPTVGSGLVPIGLPGHGKGVFRGPSGTWVVDSEARELQLHEAGGRLLRRQALPLERDEGVSSLAESPTGLVLGTGFGLLLLGRDGSVHRRAVRPHRGGDEVHGVEIDGQGRLLVAHGFGAFVVRDAAFAFAPGDSRPLAELAVPFVSTDGEHHALPAGAPPPPVAVIRTAGNPDAPSFFSSVRVANGRTLFVSRTHAALLDGDAVRLFDFSPWARAASLQAGAVDPGGNLWVGSAGTGALRVSTTAFETFGVEDGLVEERLNGIFRDRDGTVYVSSQSGFHRWRRGRLEGFRWRLPPRVKFLGWGLQQVVLRDRRGGWWLATTDGVLHWRGDFESLAGRPPDRVFARREGLCGDDAFRLFEDREGTIWVSTFGECTLSSIDPTTFGIRRFGEGDGVPRVAPSAFAEDREGNLWVGLYSGGFLRRTGGRFERFEAGDRIPASGVRQILRTRDGRLFAATGSAGLLEIPADPASHPGPWRSVTTREGLSSDKVHSLVEDRAGRLFLSTTRGVDQLDLATGRVRHLSHENALPAESHGGALLDDDGSLLFATRQGLCRLPPAEERRLPPVPTLVSAVRLAGVALPVSPNGQREVAAGEAVTAPASLEVETFGLNFEPGERLEYHYHLDGLGEPRSSTLDGRTIRFESLPAGRYRLEVEAGRRGDPGGIPAVVTFEVVPPLWRRSWFLALAAAALAGMAFALHRARLRSLVALERIRTRIATDLHDDVGSSLTRISILSEVAGRELPGDSRPRQLLGEIGETSRELIDALSDAIWSVDPRHDDLQSLLDRVKRFAAPLLEGHGLAWSFVDPPGAAAIPLAPEQRRHLHLALKEAIHNVVRHARARRVEVRAEAAGGRLRFTVTDDGAGLPPDGPRPGGRGLASLRERALLLGGTLGLAPADGGGTRVEIDVPARPKGGT